MTTEHVGRRTPSYAAYKLDNCRCSDCQEARRAYDRRRRLDPKPAYVSAARARAHVEELRAAGIGVKTIARRSGVSVTAPGKLIWGVPSDGRPPSKRIRRETEQKILAVTARDAADGGRVDATRTWQVVEQLLERGWTRVAIARAIGQERGQGLQIGRTRVLRSTAERIEALLDQPVPVRRSRWGVVESAPVEEPDSELVSRGEDLPVFPHDEGDVSWHARAACRITPGVETWMFFPGRGDVATVRAAKAVCATCPVTAECLDYALRLGEPGIWGGTSENERRRMPPAPRRCTECGGSFQPSDRSVRLCSDACRRARHKRLSAESALRTRLAQEPCACS